MPAGDCFYKRGKVILQDVEHLNQRTFKGTHEELYQALRSGKASLVVNDQRSRAFSDEYENFVLKQSPRLHRFFRQSSFDCRKRTYDGDSR